MKRFLTGVAMMTALAASPAFATEKGIHWGYSGHEGPAHWGNLAKDFETCKVGKMQSPIDLSSANVTGDIKVKTKYRPVELEILNNGHTVQFNVGNGSKMKAFDKSYELLQIHFHTPSEHIKDGKPYPMEAHFVHKAKDGALAVIGVLYVEGQENEALKPIIANLPMEPSKPTKKSVKVDATDFLPDHKNFTRYMGSLTTPPCSEGVNWHVVNSPVEASAEQIATMHEALGMNARPAQDINNRLVVEPSK